jgi:hypothetical protein
MVERLALSVEELIKAIEQTFDGVEYSTTSLRQFVLTDEFGLSRHITDSEWSEAGRNRVDSKWQEIPDSEIEECDSMLAHMQANEFRYFLPAYMVYALKNLPKSDGSNFILGSVVFSLYPSSKDFGLYNYNVKQLSLLNIDQELAVVSFLKFIASLDIYDSHDAEIALERYWWKVALIAE